MPNVNGPVPNTHPGWCSPQHCTTDDRCGDIVHLSDPATLTPDNNETWRFTLHRTDEPRSNVLGAVMLICDVTDPAFPGPDVSHWLEMEQLDALIDQLLIERNRARFLTAPTVHPTRNSVERS
jgi:hypothetical protein